MREIQFRGKRLDNGEWIEGHLLTVTLLEETAYLIFADSFQIICGEVKASLHALVNPDTVDQYTDLTDQNGKRIFEGDLCLCDRNINDSFDKTVFEIKFDPLRGYYGESRWGNEIDATCFGLCEVIGNIHDNPELLGGADG